MGEFRRTVDIDNHQGTRKEHKVLLRSASIQPQRATLCGEATLSSYGWPVSLTDSEIHRERWRD